MERSIPAPRPGRDIAACGTRRQQPAHEGTWALGASTGVVPYPKQAGTAKLIQCADNVKFHVKPSETRGGETLGAASP